MKEVGQVAQHHRHYYGEPAATISGASSRRELGRRRTGVNPTDWHKKPFQKRLNTGSRKKTSATGLRENRNSAAGTRSGRSFLHFSARAGWKLQLSQNQVCLLVQFGTLDRQQPAPAPPRKTCEMCQPPQRRHLFERCGWSISRRFRISRGLLPTSSRSIFCQPDKLLSMHGK